MSGLGDVEDVVGHLGLKSRRKKRIKDGGARGG